MSTNWYAVSCVTLLSSLKSIVFSNCLIASCSSCYCVPPWIYFTQGEQLGGSRTVTKWETEVTSESVVSKNLVFLETPSGSRQKRKHVVCLG